MSSDFEALGGADPWSLFGVGRDASSRDIQRAWRRLTKEHHPDSPTGDTERFKFFNLANDILSSPERAAEYARRLRMESEPEAAPRDPTFEEYTPPTYSDPYSWESGAGPAEPEPEPWPYDDYIPEPAPAPQPTYFNYQDYSRPTAPPPPRSWNAYAIISVALIVFGCAPVGLGFAIAALSQIRVTDERGAGLAWTTIVLNVGMVLALCCGLSNGALQSPTQ